MSRNKGGRPKKYNGLISQEQDDIINEILAGEGITGEIKKRSPHQRMMDEIDLSDLDDEFVLKTLKSNAMQGDTKAMELLGKKMGLFENKEKESLLDIFADEGTLEDNIVKLLDALEDKYPDITIDVVLQGNIQDNLRKAMEDDLQDVENDIDELDAEINSLREEVSATRPTLGKLSTGGERDLQPPSETFFPTGELSYDDEVDNFSGVSPNREDLSKVDAVLAKATKGRKGRTPRSTSA